MEDLEEKLLREKLALLHGLEHKEFLREEVARLEKKFKGKIPENKQGSLHNVEIKLKSLGVRIQ